MTLPPVLLALGAQSLVAQVQNMHWVSMASPAATWGVYCYDSTRDRIVVVDQYGTGNAEFDCRTGSWSWSAPSPRPTNFGGLVYDPLRQRSVGFEYRTNGPVMMPPLTWEWDGSTWAQAVTTLPPSFMGGSCYHSGRGRVVQVVSVDYSGSNYSFYTYLVEWDGAQWSYVPSPNTPSSSSGFGPAIYDSSRDKLVVFGVRHGTLYSITPETWEWDGVNGWVLVNTVGPTNAYGASLLFDESRGVQVLHVFCYPVVWQVWERVGSGPWVRNPAGDTQDPDLLGVYDSVRGRSLLIQSDLVMRSWEPVHPASFRIHGTGCPGSVGAPSLAATRPWTLPRLGDSLGVTLSNLPQSVGFLAMGFQDQMSGTLPLPYPLAGIGMPSCFLRVSMDATLLLLGANQEVSFQLPIPAANPLLGLSFYQQGLSFDPAANAAGFAVTNSAVGVIGSW